MVLGPGESNLKIGNVYLDLLYSTQMKFLIYINDICAVSIELHIILFADDTNVFFSHKNLNSLIKTVNFELIKITSWFQVNRLSINIKKTKNMLFKPRQKRQTLDHLTL